MFEHAMALADCKHPWGAKVAAPRLDQPLLASRAGLFQMMLAALLPQRGEAEESLFEQLDWDLLEHARVYCIRLHNVL